jgi:hypothetical protein
MALNNYDTNLMIVYLEDFDGVKIYDEVSPSVSFNFDTTRFGLGYSDYAEILRPKDFAAIGNTTAFKYDNWRVNFNNNTFNTVEFGASYRSGTTLNLVPPRGSLPNIADTSRIDVDLLWRPFDRLRVSNTYLYTELESRQGQGKVFSNEILRSNWNYQFNREWSLRFIAQYEETDAGVATRLTDDKNLNFDLLLRYVINPWSAFYIGYNTNRSNFDIIELEGERELVVTNDLRKDGDQIFLKFSYLFQR